MAVLASLQEHCGSGGWFSRPLTEQDFFFFLFFFFFSFFFLGGGLNVTAQLLN